MKRSLIFVLLVLYTIVQGNAQQPPIDVGTTDCLCPVPTNIDYVCGSNGATYTNPSALDCAEKCTKKRITVAHPGQCP